jgi:hypothetical protein
MEIDILGLERGHFALPHPRPELTQDKRGVVWGSLFERPQDQVFLVGRKDVGERIPAADPDKLGGLPCRIVPDDIVFDPLLENTGEDTNDIMDGFRSRPLLFHLPHQRPNLGSVNFIQAA